jgi:RHS repeat-associated protein
MKWLVILLILVILPSISAKEVSIPELFEVFKPINVSSGPYAKEVNYYAGSKLIAVNDKYKYQDRMGSDVESRSLPFGQSLDIENRFSFTGKELDKDLHYFNARYYDSNLGKFTSVDPVRNNHAYSYVRNNPMNYVDPTGMDFMGILSALNLNAPRGGRNIEISAMGPIQFNTVQGQNDIQYHGLFGYSSNPIIGGKYGVLRIGDETQEFIYDMQNDISEIYASQGAVGVFEYVDSMAYENFDYAHYRYNDGGATALYNLPYEGGKEPELIYSLCEGNAVCYEKALFTAEVLNTNRLINEEWIAVPLLTMIRTTDYSTGSTDYSSHMIVGMQRKGATSEEGYEYYITWGEVYDPVESEAGIGIKGGSWAFTDVSYDASKVPYLGSAGKAPD